MAKTFEEPQEDQAPQNAWEARVPQIQSNEVENCLMYMYVSSLCVLFFLIGWLPSSYQFQYHMVRSLNNSKSPVSWTGNAMTMSFQVFNREEATANCAEVVGQTR